MASPSPCRRIHHSPRLTLEVLSQQEPVEFNAAFLERRLRQHAEFMRMEEEFITAQIVREVEARLIEKIEKAAELAGLK